MAGKQIVRLITLVFNRQAAAQAAAQMRSFLNGVGNQAKLAGGQLGKAFAMPLSFSKLKTGISDLMRLTGQGVVAVLGYGKAWMELGERGGKVITVQKAFNALTGDGEGAIQKLRKASRGLISDYDLMRQANLALQLGAVRNADQMAELVSVSQDLGRALGIDSVKALNDLTIGVGRNSKRILDNLGIIVKGAVTVENAMEAARERVEQLGGSVETGADQIRRFQIAFINFRDALGKFLAESDVTKVFFFEMAQVLQTLTSAINTGDIDIIKDAFRRLGEIAGDAFKFGFFGALGTMHDMFDQVEGDVSRFMLKGFVLPLIGIGQLSQKAADEQLKQMQEHLDEFEKFGDRVDKLLESRTARGTPRTLPPIIDPEAAENARKEQDEILNNLIKAHELGAMTNTEWRQLLDIFIDANRELAKGNLVTEERIHQVERLTKAAEALGLVLGKPGEGEAALADIMSKRLIEANQEISRRTATPQAAVPMSMEELRLSRQRAGTLFGQTAGGLSLEVGPEGPGRVIETQARSIFAAPALAAVQASIFKRIEKDLPRGATDPSKLAALFMDNFDTIEGAAQMAFGGIQQAWENAFLAMGDKSQAFKDLEMERSRRLAEAQNEVQRQRIEEWYELERKNVEEMDGLWETLAKGFAASVLSGLAAVAGAKVQENVAKALAAVGDALLGNPGGWAAAAKFTAAAAAWAALGGAAGAAARSLGGGGGAGGGFRGGSISGDSVDDEETSRPLTLYLRVDGVDPDNPAHIEILHKAGLRGAQQWGSQMPTTRRYEINTRRATRRGDS